MLIGEVAKRSGVSARMLRHYESLGLVAPSARTSSGYREYSEADIGRIFHIEGLRKLGMSLADVGGVLSAEDFDPAAMLADLIDRTRERIAAEEHLLEHLEAIARLRRPDGESLLYTIDLMRSLESGDVIQRHKAALGSGVDGRVPVEALSAAVLGETVLNAAGAMRWALAQAGAEAVPHLVEGMGSESAQVRRNALHALDEIRRTTPAEELGTIAHSAIGQALRSGLVDDDAEVRSTAALALGALHEEAAVPTLLDMALEGPKDIEAAEALAAFVTGSSRPAAAAEGRTGGSTEGGTGGSAEGRGAAGARTGADSIGEEIITALRRQADAGDTAKRFRVLQVLLEIPGPQIDAFIAELSGDDSPELAATAHAALRRRRRNDRDSLHWPS
ncbi:MerR family transcriptional regulator [Brevibacterium spongiae]|uniref:MerR family transcriptional regulator n=1 Tax=Brevibacterium spongiae TaxID=2909672 RepID=A0ABY5SVN1_9MICO|nr:MerR family transcriptional regulator [Brevibacterium spongiae]UVI37961.1 MerR family transcriptional regulator [Brevibacterium spongiae]